MNEISWLQMSSMMFLFILIMILSLNFLFYTTKNSKMNFKMYFFNLIK